MAWKLSRGPRRIWRPTESLGGQAESLFGQSISQAGQPEGKEASHRVWEASHRIQEARQPALEDLEVSQRAFLAR